MEPETFDGTAGVALLLLLPTSVLFVAAAIRRSGAPRWAWVCFLLGVGGLLVLLHLAGGVRYPVDAPEPNALSTWDFFQFVGLGVGRIGVGVNAVVATAWCILRPEPYDEYLPRRETSLVVAAYATMAVATALPAAWWASGRGVVPLVVELPVALAAVAFLTTALLLRWRRLRALAEDERPLGFPWPTDAGVAVVLVGALAVGPLAAGSGLPDASLVVDHPDAERRPSTARTADPEWPGPTPAAATTRDASAIEGGTRTLLEDTIDRAGPLDDLAAPTPARAAAPPVDLAEERCDGGGRRWTGSLVLPTVRPQDVASRILAGWRAAGYAPVDRAMGTDLLGPVVPDAAVERMRLGGGADGVHVDVESFCTTG